MFSATNWTGRNFTRCLHSGFRAMGLNKLLLFYFIAYVLGFWDEDDINHVLDIGKDKLKKNWKNRKKIWKKVFGKILKSYAEEFCCEMSL